MKYIVKDNADPEKWAVIESSYPPKNYYCIAHSDVDHRDGSIITVKKYYYNPKTKLETEIAMNAEPPSVTYKPEGAAQNITVYPSAYYRDEIDQTLKIARDNARAAAIIPAAKLKRKNELIQKRALQIAEADSVYKTAETAIDAATTKEEIEAIDL